MCCLGFIVIGLLSCSSLFSMNGSNGQLIKEVLIYNGKFFNDTLDRLLLVDKGFKDSIERIANQRKKFIKSYELAKEMPIDEERILWHRDGIACAWSVINKNNLELHLVRIGEGGVLHNMSCVWTGYKSLVLSTYNKRPFFQCDERHSKDEKISFYGCGMHTYIGYGKQEGIVEYSLNFNGKPAALRCKMDLNIKKGRYQSLARIQNHPALLQAFLASKQMSEHSAGRRGDRAKVCNINGVIIPDDYGSKKYVLPNVIEKSIVKRYQAQQCKHV